MAVGKCISGSELVRVLVDGGVEFGQDLGRSFISRKMFQELTFGHSSKISERGFFVAAHSSLWRKLKIKYVEGTAWV